MTYSSLNAAAREQGLDDTTYGIIYGTFPFGEHLLAQQQQRFEAVLSQQNTSETEPGSVVTDTGTAIGQITA